MLEDAEQALGALLDTSGGYTPARSPRAPAPKGFEPGVKYDPTGVPTEVITPAGPHLPGQPDWDKAVEDMGFTVPEGYTLRLVEAKYDPAAWHRDMAGTDAVTRPVWRYKFAVEVSITGTESSIEALAQQIRKSRPRKALVKTGEGSLVVSWNDWQLFKSAGDGIEGTVQRIYDSFDLVADRVKELRRVGRAYPRLVVAGTGDIVEGCNIYPNQVWELQGDSRDQENVGRRLIVEGLKSFAHLFEEIQVVAVGGNHGENRIEGKRNNRHDNADCKVFEQAADVLSEREDLFGHIRFMIPTEDLAATVSVEDWVLGLTHGHIAGRSAGGPEAKMLGWYAKQAAGKRPAGDADVLLTSHYHHFRAADWGGCMWLQAPTMDGGSPYFEDSSGSSAPAGLLTFGMTPNERMRDLDVTWL